MLTFCCRSLSQMLKMLEVDRSKVTSFKLEDMAHMLFLAWQNVGNHLPDVDVVKTVGKVSNFHIGWKS